MEELHSKFIHYLLDPKATHDCGSLFLKLFIDTILENKAVRNDTDKFELISNISISELEIARVAKEESIPSSDDVELYGRVDIIVETASFLFVIENKINAREQSQQILRYAKYCKSKNKQFVVLYLTKFGEQSQQNGDELYFSISYKDEIRSWLQKCIIETLAENYLFVYPGLRYYSDLLTNSILNMSTDKVPTEVIELILNDENKIILKHLHLLRDAVTPIRNRLRTAFFIKILELVNNDGNNFIPVSDRVKKISTSEVWDKPYRGFILDSPQWLLSINNHKIVFCIEHDWDTLYYGLIVINDKGECLPTYTAIEGTSEIHEQMNRLMGYTLPQPEHSWFAWKHFSYYGTEFNNDNFNYDFATKLDNIVLDLVNEVNAYLRVWKKVIDERR